MRRAALGLIGLLIFSGCADEGGTAGPGGTGGSAGAGAGGSAGSASGGASGSGGGAGTGGSCEATSPSLARAGETFVVPTLAETAPKRNPDVAHDPVHDVYLVVSGAAAISGTFLDADGQSLAPPFAVAQTSAYVQSPRVAYGGGKLLVAWHDNRGATAPEVWARLIQWNGSAPELTAADFAVGSNSQSHQEMPPGLAHSQTSGVFLVVWQAIADNDLLAQRVDATGALVGAPIAITADADWQSGAAVAWNAAHDEFLVTWTHAGAAGAAVRARRISAADGSLLGDEVEIATAAGTWTSQVVELPCDDRYLAAWVAGGGTAFARTLDAAGTPEGAPIPFPAEYGYPEGFALAYHAGLGWSAAVMHGPSDEDFGLSVSTSGEPGPVLQVTETPGDLGHFNPRITASGTRSEWMLVTSRGFEDVVAQRLAP